MESENNLIDGKYSFSDIIDVDKLESIFTKFSNLTGFTIGLVDNHSLEIIIKTGWHEICKIFHRADEIACKVCRKSNKILFADLANEKSVRIVECEHGLYDSATPIFIENKHVANLVTGQLLLQNPKIERFEKQATEFNFNKKEYLNALEKVPIVSKEKVTEVMNYLAEFSLFIAEQGLGNMRIERLNKDLEKEKRKAEESDKLKTEFINNMSHEIRTPMNGILGFSKILNQPNLTEVKKRQYITIIQNSGNQLMRIVDDILEISKLGTKQVESCYKEVCLNNLLLELFLFFDMKAKENKMPLYLNKGLSDKESVIFTDETILNKILTNLLENALKFTREGFIEFGYKVINNKIELYVKDTGIGIEQESQKKIFDRFSQEEKSLEQKVGGLGLGLSIAKENIELLDGKITVHSKKGSGTTFFVTIPYKSTN